MLQRTVQAGVKHQIPVSLCGELAGQVRAAPLILGLGFRELSIMPASLPEVRRVIRNVSVKNTQILAESALNASSAQAISGLLDEFAATYALHTPTIF